VSAKKDSGMDGALTSVLCPPACVFVCSIVAQHTGIMNGVPRVKDSNLQDTVMSDSVVLRRRDFSGTDFMSPSRSREHNVFLIDCSTLNDVHRRSTDDTMIRRTRSAHGRDALAVFLMTGDQRQMVGGERLRVLFSALPDMIFLPQGRVRTVHTLPHLHRDDP